MELNVTKSKTAGENSKINISLVGTATIGEVEKIKAVLLDAFIECCELVLDVKDVIAFDYALLQLIHSARQTASQTGIRFSLAGESSAVFHEMVILSGILSENYNVDESAQVALEGVAYV